jgi:hypothetical protein
MAEIGGEVDDELTFKQDGMLVETRFTFPDLNARTFKTFVELGDCIPTCDEVRWYYMFVYCHCLARSNKGLKLRVMVAVLLHATGHGIIARI